MRYIFFDFFNSILTYAWGYVILITGTENKDSKEDRKATSMKKIKLTSKEAYKLAEILNIDINDDGISFYATNEDKTEIWSFDTKRERDSFIAK